MSDSRLFSSGKKKIGQSICIFRPSTFVKGQLRVSRLTATARGAQRGTRAEPRDAAAQEHRLGNSWRGKGQEGGKRSSTEPWTWTGHSKNCRQLGEPRQG